METEQKIWGVLALFFFVIAMAAIITHALWFVATVAAPLILTGIISVLRNLHPFPVLMIVPPNGPTFDGVGMMGAMFLLFLLNVENAINIPIVSVFISVFATAMGYFCVLMMVRPVNTHFGILYGLCFVSITLGLQEFEHGWQTRLVIGVSSLMLLLRGLLETRAEMNVARRRAAAAAD